MPLEYSIPITIRVSLDIAPLQAATPIAAGNVAAAHGATEGSKDTGTVPHLHKFNLASLSNTGFHWLTALSLALASRIAYSNADTIESITTDTWKFHTCEFIEADDTQCFVAVSTTAVLVAFRGTENLGDWLANLNSIGTSRSYGEVHRGFLGAFQVVQGKLESLLSNYSHLPILLTGHSLGGALALIAAAEWKARNFAISQVHTFGQPAVGKKNFRDFIEGAYGRKYHRFVNDDDLVPMVPPWFTHCGSLIHFNRQGDLENAIVSRDLESLGIELDPLPLETPIMSETEFDLMRASLLQKKAAGGGTPLDETAVAQATTEAATLEGLGGFLPSISDHKMDLYISKVARKAGL